MYGKQVRVEGNSNAGTQKYSRSWEFDSSRMLAVSTGKWRRIRKSVKGKRVKFVLEQATKAQMGSWAIDLIFL
jgi:hypothetical protein